MEKNNGYCVIIKDASGSPVPGVQLQFCSDFMCQMKETDKDGFALFAPEEGFATVHIHFLPEEYERNEKEYKLEEGDLTITVYPAKEEK